VLIPGIVASSERATSPRRIFGPWTLRNVRAVRRRPIAMKPLLASALWLLT
jgi:hypothetical protein